MNMMSSSLKYVIIEAYHIGMSKYNIYKTLKLEGVNVTRREVYKILDRSMYYTNKNTKYRIKYEAQPGLVRSGMVQDLEHQRFRLNKSYLQWIILTNLNDKIIRYTPEFKNFVHKIEYFNEWVS